MTGGWKLALGAVAAFCLGFAASVVGNDLWIAGLLGFAVCVMLLCVAFDA